MKDHKATLGLMKDAARKTSLFLKGYKMRKFLMDGKTQSAVIMQLIVIGELAKKVPDRAKKKINLPWRLIAGFRGQHHGNFVGKVRPPGARALLRRSPSRSGLRSRSYFGEAGQAAGYSPAFPIRKAFHANKDSLPRQSPPEADPPSAGA